MNLGALIDVGVPEAFLAGELQRLSLPEEFRLEVSRGEKMGIVGTRVDVILETRSDSAPHRDYRSIRSMIEAAPYGATVRARASAMFRVIAEAEAKIHGKPLDSVHFHEVGATDSIVDILGAAIALDYLDVDIVLSTSVEVGGGHVECAHGTFPVPAPATAEILTGVPCRYGTVDGESTTPTGAAILRTTVEQFNPQDEFVPERTGYGIGDRDFAIPNVLRVQLGEYRPAAVGSGLPTAQSYEISTNIDDMSAEGFELLFERLLEAGASDVFLTPIVMKKSRLAQMVTVLCEAAERERLVRTLLENSSTIGVRVQPVYKETLARKVRSVETRYGAVDVKIVELPEGERRWKVEHDDVARIARQRSESYASVRAAIEIDVAQEIGLPGRRAGDATS